MFIDKEVFTSTKKKGTKTAHHRKPRSLGGNGDARNISYVPKSEHRAWTTLFDNLPALDVVESFKKYLEMFGNEARTLQEIRHIGLEVLCELEILQDQIGMFDFDEAYRIRDTLKAYRCLIKKWRAWRLLFSGLSLEEKIAKVNGTWLDPDFEIIIRVTQLKEVVGRAKDFS